jgi:hypothetical protein
MFLGVLDDLAGGFGASDVACHFKGIMSGSRKPRFCTWTFVLGNDIEKPSETWCVRQPYSRREPGEDLFYQYIYIIANLFIFCLLPSSLCIFVALCTPNTSSVQIHRFQTKAFQFLRNGAHPLCGVWR